MAIFNPLFILYQYAIMLHGQGSAGTGPGKSYPKMVGVAALDNTK
jgi:hypothetical protein